MSTSRRLAVADALAVVEHRRLVLLALADHDDAVHVDGADIMCRIASTAAWSAAFLSPRPTQRAAASAAASVTRTSSRARLRSGVWRCMAAIVEPAAGAARAGTRRRGAWPTCSHRSTSPPSRAPLPGPHARGRGPARAVPRRARRLAGAEDRDRGRSPATCERSNANLGGPFVTSEESDAVVEDARAAAADLTGATAGRDRVRAEHDDAQLPARARRRRARCSRATRSSSRSSTTTRTSARGCASRATTS